MISKFYSVIEETSTHKGARYDVTSYFRSLQNITEHCLDVRKSNCSPHQVEYSASVWHNILVIIDDTQKCLHQFSGWELRVSLGHTNWWASFYRDYKTLTNLLEMNNIAINLLVPRDEAFDTRMIAKLPIQIPFGAPQDGQPSRSPFGEDKSVVAVLWRQSDGEGISPTVTKLAYWKVVSVKTCRCPTTCTGYATTFNQITQKARVVYTYKINENNAYILYL